MHPGSLVEEHDHVDEKVAAAPPLVEAVVGAASVEVPAESPEGPQQAEGRNHPQDETEAEGRKVLEQQDSRAGEEEGAGGEDGHWSVQGQQLKVQALEQGPREEWRT